MRRITYRQKLYLKKTLKILGILLAVVVIGVVVFLQCVERYVVYTADGAVIDYSRSAQDLQVVPQTPTAATTPPQVEISYEAARPADVDTLVKGVWVSSNRLDDVEALSAQLLSLDSEQSILLELKDTSGNFYYDTAIEDAPKADIDTEAVSQMIAQLRSNGYNLIALVPAFCDYSFALSNQLCALSTEDGVLWADADNCYWLDPADETVTDYLRQIANELSGMGFTEVVFEDFEFPSSSEIDYDADQSPAQVITQAVGTLTGHFAGSKLTVSFATADTDFPTEDLGGRLYIENVDTAQLEQYIVGYSNLDAQTQLVFLTNSKDPRFDNYSTLAALS